MIRHLISSCAWFVVAALVALAVVASPPLRAQDERPDRYQEKPDVDWPMYLDPYIEPAPRIPVFDPRLKDLWVLALERPDAETRRRAAIAIGYANGRGMEGLGDTADALLKAINADDQHSMVRLAAAEALAKLDHRAAADSYLKLATRELSERWSLAARRDLILLTDPVLAAWDVKAAQGLWRSRLNDEAVGRAVRLSAINALRLTKDTQAVDALGAIALDKTSETSARLAAGRAVGGLVDKGLEADAKALASGTIVDRIVGASLLTTHQSDAAIAQLQAYAVDTEPTVAAIALSRLLEIDPLLIAPLVDRLITNNDARVRRLVAQAVVAQHSVDAVRRLGPLLDDPSSDVRQYVRTQLIAMAADAKLDEAVRQASMSVLNGDGWRGQIAAAIVLGRLDHEPAADRLVALMHGTPRGDVRMAAIVALRRLAVVATLPAMHQQAERMSKEWQDAVARSKANPKDGIPRSMAIEYDDQLAQLMQAMGNMRYAPAEPLMKKYIPKDSGYNPESRAGAIWAMGWLHEDAPDDALVEQFRQRLSDTNPLMPEHNSVRRASAVAIGRMKSTKATATLTKFMDEEKYTADVGGSCRWALMRITGNDLPPLPSLEAHESGFFLAPLDRPAKQP